MKNFSKFFKFSIASLLVTFVLTGLFQVNITYAATTPTLGLAASYGILSDTYTNPTGPTTINGDVGFTTAPAVVPLGIHANYGSLVPYAQAGLDQATALAALNSQGCTFTFVAPAVVLDTTIEHTPIYEPGVYCNNGTLAIGTAAGITLSGAGTYIFRSNGALNTVVGSNITLTNGASACDIFWTPKGATTLNANSNFIGTIIPDVAFDITMLNATTLLGRALAFGHTVTTPNTNVTITVPVCPIIIIPPVPVVKASPSGGGAGVSLIIDSCPDGDYSSSYYDRTCGTIPAGNNSLRNIPAIGITNIPNIFIIPGNSGNITYTYTVWNIGAKQALNNIDITDTTCKNIVYVSGDTNKNNKLDINEKRIYTCTTKLTTTTTNNAIANGYSDDSYHQIAIANAIATVGVGTPLPPPLISIVKIPSRITPFPFGGGHITYTYTVTNPGIVPMYDIKITDDKCDNIMGPYGDNDENNILDINELRTYTCQMYIETSTRNIAKAEGKANGFLAQGYSIANVLVAHNPGLPHTGFHFQQRNNTLRILGLIMTLIIVTSTTILLRNHKSPGNTK